MAVGGVDAALLPAALREAPADLAADVAPAAPLSPEVMFRDEFELAHSAPPKTEPELLQAKREARQDLRQAKRTLRREKNEANPERGQVIQKRAAVREARQDFRAAKRELEAARSGGLNEDAFTPAPARPTPTPVPTPTQTPVPVEPGLPQPANGLTLGRTLPNISQLTPAGAEDGGYANALANCGPASVAMLSRGQMNRFLDGKPVQGMSDAELIMRLGAHGQTDAEGTSPNGIVAMGEALNMQTSSLQGGFNQEYYDSVLAQGGSVVANGALERDGELFGHYVTVSAKTDDGRYMVNDPWNNETVFMSAAQLDTYLKSNPVNGGWSVGLI